MSAQTSTGVEAPPAPEIMVGLEELRNEKSPQYEDFFVSQSQLYMPEEGQFRPDRQKKIEGGSVIIGTYITRRAMHRTGVYLPEGYESADSNPVVVRTSALGTGIKGFNDVVSREILDTGSVVISKGPPRYYGPTLRALTQTEDANEMHGLVNAVERQGIIGASEEVWVDGQSQSAMKALGFMALSPYYNRRVENGHVVAPCFLDRANVRNPRKFIRYGTSMLQSIARAGQNIGLQELLELRETVSVKDMHHHIIVLPVLLSGETGTFLPHIDPGQEAAVDLYGLDRSSRAHRAHTKLSTLFANMDVTLHEAYGHVDGINSPETKAKRQEVFTNAVQRRDARPNLRVLT